MTAASSATSARANALHEGQRGFCFVRQAQDGGIVLTSYGRASGFLHRIEKKAAEPLLSRQA
jgi:hypothetical protein